MRAVCSSCVLLGLLLSAGCVGGSDGPTGVTTGCTPGAATTSTLAALCADPEAYMGRRVTLAGAWDWGIGVHSSCTLIACPPDSCCNICEASHRLPCPTGDRDIYLEAAPAIDLPQVSACNAAGCGGPSTSFGCVGLMDNDFSSESPCAADWHCMPEVATICSAGGRVTRVDAATIMLTVDSLDLTALP